MKLLLGLFQFDYLFVFFSYCLILITRFDPNKKMTDIIFASQGFSKTCKPPSQKCGIEPTTPRAQSIYQTLKNMLFTLSKKNRILEINKRFINQFQQLQSSIFSVTCTTMIKISYTSVPWHGPSKMSPFIVIRTLQGLSIKPKGCIQCNHTQYNSIVCLCVSRCVIFRIMGSVMQL